MPVMRYRALVVAMALCVLPCSSLAQTAGDPLRIGDRLRVRSEGETAIGVVTVVGERGFDLVQGRSIRSFEFDHIKFIERSDGMRRQWRKGALYGGLAGAMLGAVIGYRDTVCDGNFFEQLLEPDEVTCESGNLSSTVGSGLGMGGALGAVGAGVGWLIEREAWVNITMPQRGITLRPIFGNSTRSGRPAMVFGIRIGPSGVVPRDRPSPPPIRNPEILFSRGIPSGDTWRR